MLAMAIKDAAHFGNHFGLACLALGVVGTVRLACLGQLGLDRWIIRFCAFDNQVITTVEQAEIFLVARQLQQQGSGVAIRTGEQALVDRVFLKEFLPGQRQVDVVTAQRAVTLCQRAEAGRRAEQ